MSVIVAPWCVSEHALAGHAVVCLSVHRFGLVLILGNPAHMEIAQTLQKQLLGGSEIARLTPFGSVRQVGLQCLQKRTLAHCTATEDR